MHQYVADALAALDANHFRQLQKIVEAEAVYDRLEPIGIQPPSSYCIARAIYPADKRELPAIRKALGCRLIPMPDEREALNADHVQIAVKPEKFPFFRILVILPLPAGSSCSIVKETEESYNLVCAV